MINFTELFYFIVEKAHLLVKWFHAKTFINVFMCFAFVYLSIVLCIFLEREKDKSYFQKKYLYNFAKQGLLFAAIYAFFEQFNFGEPHKYYRAGFLGASIAFGLKKSKDIKLDYEKKTEELSENVGKDLVDEDISKIKQDFVEFLKKGIK